MISLRSLPLQRWLPPLLVLAAALPGCVLDQPLKSDPAALAGDLPASWVSDRHRVPGAATTGWLSDFRSTQLETLVDEAVHENPGLAAARSRVRQAEESARIAGADRLPTLDLGISTTRSQNLRGANFTSVRANNFNSSLSLSWEVDLWGRVRDLRDAQVDLLGAESNAHQWTRLSLAANVVKSALEIVESRLQVGLNERNLRSLETNLDILDSKLEAGDAEDRTALDISLSRADIARSRSTILAEQRQADAARRTLETLLGRYPRGTVEALSSLPSLPRKVPAGLPSELLLRRPDLVEAELRVDARLKELSASRKALLPAIRITGGAGTSSTDEFGDLFDIQNLVWNIGANLAQPLYRGGRLRADIRLDQHELDEIAETYAESALAAFREVETALAAERYLSKQVAQLEIAVREARRAEDLSLDQYERGLVDIITLLESQRRAFDSQSTLLDAKLQLLQNRVDLYLALGGDFDSPIERK